MSIKRIARRAMQKRINHRPAGFVKYGEDRFGDTGGNGATNKVLPAKKTTVVRRKKSNN